MQFKHCSRRRSECSNHSGAKRNRLAPTAINGGTWTQAGPAQRPKPAARHALHAHSRCDEAKGGRGRLASPHEPDPAFHPATSKPSGQPPPPPQSPLLPSTPHRSNGRPDRRLQLPGPRCAALQRQPGGPQELHRRPSGAAAAGRADCCSLQAAITRIAVCRALTLRMGVGAGCARPAEVRGEGLIQHRGQPGGCGRTGEGPAGEGETLKMAGASAASPRCRWLIACSLLRCTSSRARHPGVVSPWACHALRRQLRSKVDGWLGPPRHRSPFQRAPPAPAAGQTSPAGSHAAQQPTGRCSCAPWLPAVGQGGEQDLGDRVRRRRHCRAVAGVHCRGCPQQHPPGACRGPGRAESCGAWQGLCARLLAACIWDFWMDSIRACFCTTAARLSAGSTAAAPLPLLAALRLAATLGTVAHSLPCGTQPANAPWPPPRRPPHRSCPRLLSWLAWATAPGSPTATCCSRAAARSWLRTSSR